MEFDEKHLMLSTEHTHIEWLSQMLYSKCFVWLTKFQLFLHWKYLENIIKCCITFQNNNTPREVFCMRLTQSIKTYSWDSTKFRLLSCFKLNSLQVLLRVEGFWYITLLFSILHLTKNTYFFKVIATKLYYDSSIFLHIKMLSKIYRYRFTTGRQLYWRRHAGNVMMSNYGRNNLLIKIWKLKRGGENQAM